MEFLAFYGQVSMLKCLLFFQFSGFGSLDPPQQEISKLAM